MKRFSSIFVLAGFSLAAAASFGYGAGWGNANPFTGAGALFGGAKNTFAALCGFVLCMGIARLELRDDTSAGRTLTRIIGGGQIVAGVLAAMMVWAWGAGFWCAASILVLALVLAGAVTPRAERHEHDNRRQPGRLKKAWRELFPAKESSSSSHDDQAEGDSSRVVPEA